jgi:hypothetical protein
MPVDQPNTTHPTPIEPPTLVRSLGVARSVLGAFWDNSAYEDYRREDGWTDAEYETMLADLDRLAEAATAVGTVVVLARNEEENDRDVFLRVYADRAAAEAARRDDLARSAGGYDPADYTLIASGVE